MWEVGSRSREMRLWVIWLTLSTCLIIDYTCVFDTFMCIFAYACAYVSMHVYVCVDVCVHVCACVYVCVHKYTCVHTRWCMCRFVHTHWSDLLTCYVLSLHMYTHVSACTRKITYVGDSLDFIAPWLIFIDFHANSSMFIDLHPITRTIVYRVIFCGSHLCMACVASAGMHA